MASGKFDVGAILKKAAITTDEKPSKSKTPIVDLPGVADSVKDWLKANADLKDAESRKATAEAAMLPSIEDARVGECRRDGRHYSSVKVNGKITVSSSNAYSNISVKDYETIEAMFGDKAESFFKTRTDISLTDAALADETIMQKLITAVGPEKFAQYFKVEQFVKPTEVFHEQRSTNAEIGAKADVLKAQGLLKQNKAAVKQG